LVKKDIRGVKLYAGYAHDKSSSTLELISRMRLQVESRLRRLDLLNKIRNKFPQDQSFARRLIS
jgi:hypothetical protein